MNNLPYLNMESVPELPVPTRKQRVETYLYDNSIDTFHVEALANSYAGELSLARTIVAIPVAAHSEAANIYNTLKGYALQKDCDPFSVCLFLNWPEGTLEAELEASDRAIDMASRDFPNLDVRTAGASYKTPTIGLIRKTLWDHLVYLAYAEGQFDGDNETIGINQDIDMISATPHYICNIQTYYKERKIARENHRLSTQLPYVSRYTQTHHAYPFQELPNLARAVFWYDLAARQYAPLGSYEAGMVIPFSYYVQKGGFDPSAKSYETSKFSEAKPKGIPKTSMVTSPRRFLERLPRVGFEDVWTNDSFSITDPCRDPELKLQDITPARLEQLVLGNLNRDLQMYLARWEDKIYKYFIEKQDVMTGLNAAKEVNDADRAVREIMKNRIAVLRRMAERVIGSQAVIAAIDKYDVNASTGSFK